MKQVIKAYLDIETTGFSSARGEITVVGIHLDNGVDNNCIQLVGMEITASEILDAVNGAGVIYTYNGSRFDLPFIYTKLGINLAEDFNHRDLMYDCWKCNLYGGLKAVERQLGIERRLKEIDGREAVRLWWRYLDYSDLDALKTLLEYNKEDVLNLRVLRQRLL